MKIENLNEALVHDGLMALADQIAGFFPNHAKAIRDEMTQWTMDDDGNWHSSHRKMTDTRWNRVADIICSLAAVPGTFLSEEARWVRVQALCKVEAPRAMARHCFGGARAYGALDLAAWIMAPLTVSSHESTAR